MSLRERSHAAYLRPETKVDVEERKNLAENDNDRPRTVFEETLERIQAEYTEAEAQYEEAMGHIKVLEQDLQLLWQEIENAGLQTRASASLTEEYVQLQKEYQALLGTKEELNQTLDRLRLECEPFQALQEAIPQMHASSAEVRRLRDEEHAFHAEAVSLREQWSQYEGKVAQVQERLDQEEEFTAATQRDTIDNVQGYQAQVAAFKLHTDKVHTPEYQRYFTQMDQWFAAQTQVLASLVQKRERIQSERQGLKEERAQILNRYDACMERQLEVLRQLGDAERDWAAAQAQHQYGLAGAGESMQARGTLSPDQPAWVGGHQVNSENTDPTSLERLHDAA